MKISTESQATFLDADYLCGQLIAQDSFYRKFRDHVWPVIKDKHFEEMYCSDNGRPPISPRLLAMATILQFHRNLSDREMERACMYDIEIKFALGLRLDERPFDHSSLGDFRKRLLKSGKEKAVFDRILQHLVKSGLIKENETQRIDATHVIADIAIPTMVTLVKKGTFEILKYLHQNNSRMEKKVRAEIQSEEYTKEEINHTVDGRLDVQKRQEKLVGIVYDAKKVLKAIASVERGDVALREKADLLRRILQENIHDDENGVPRERPMGKAAPDMLVSPIDPDARFGAKSISKRFLGYKTSITQAVKSRFITNVSAMPGNQHDSKPTIDLVLEQQKFGLIPKRLIGDSAYGFGVNRHTLRKHGTKVIAPLYTRNDRTKNVLPKSLFKYNAKKGKIVCPEGVTTRTSWYDYGREIRTFHFPVAACSVCPRKSECTTSKENRRTINIGLYDRDLARAEKFNRTEKFKKYMRLRQPIEGKFSELKRNHGLTRARYRGLKKVGLQSFFSVTAVNIKRWMNLISEQMRPKQAMA
jgi:transposase